MDRTIDRRRGGTGAWTGCCALALLLAAAGPAQAEPAFARMYKQVYGYVPSCNACHKDGGGTPLDAYGQQFKDAGMDLAAFERIAALDADGDGHDNATEARAKSDPSDPDSVPGRPGRWLDTESLIPTEVQALFPGVRSYLPRDATLTEADLARARQMGVSLSLADGNNTIYIPVQDRRPVGTALIVPAQYDGRVFYLLVATDRRLVITTVQPLNTRLVPEARDPVLYERFVGLPANAVPPVDGEGIQAAIAEAVRRAGALLWVRLKGA